MLSDPDQSTPRVACLHCGRRNDPAHELCPKCCHQSQVLPEACACPRCRAKRKDRDLAGAAIAALHGLSRESFRNAAALATLQGMCFVCLPGASRQEIDALTAHCWLMAESLAAGLTTPPHGDS